MSSPIVITNIPEGLSVAPTPNVDLYKLLSVLVEKLPEKDRTSEKLPADITTALQALLIATPLPAQNREIDFFPNRNERASVEAERTTETGMYIEVHEDFEEHAASTDAHAIGLERSQMKQLLENSIHSDEQIAAIATAVNPQKKANNGATEVEQTLTPNPIVSVFQQGAYQQTVVTSPLLTNTLHTGSVQEKSFDLRQLRSPLASTKLTEALSSTTQHSDGSHARLTSTRPYVSTQIAYANNFDLSEHPLAPGSSANNYQTDVQTPTAQLARPPLTHPQLAHQLAGATSNQSKTVESTQLPVTQTIPTKLTHVADTLNFLDTLARVEKTQMELALLQRVQTPIASEGVANGTERSGFRSESLFVQDVQAPQTPEPGRPSVPFAITSSRHDLASTATLSAAPVVTNGMSNSMDFDLAAQTSPARQNIPAALQDGKVKAPTAPTEAPEGHSFTPMQSLTTQQANPIHEDTLSKIERTLSQPNTRPVVSHHDQRQASASSILNFFPNRSERASVEVGSVDQFTSETGAYIEVHEDFEERTASNHVRTVGLKKSLLTNHAVETGIRNADQPQLRQPAPSQQSVDSASAPTRPTDFSFTPQNISAPPLTGENSSTRHGQLHATLQQHTTTEHGTFAPTQKPATSTQHSDSSKDSSKIGNTRLTAAPTKTSTRINHLQTLETNAASMRNNQTPTAPSTVLKPTHTQPTAMPLNAMPFNPILSTSGDRDIEAKIEHAIGSFPSGSERARTAETGMYIEAHENFEERAASNRVRTVGLERSSMRKSTGEQAMGLQTHAPSPSTSHSDEIGFNPALLASQLTNEDSANINVKLNNPPQAFHAANLTPDLMPTIASAPEIEAISSGNILKKHEANDPVSALTMTTHLEASATTQTESEEFDPSSPPMLKHQKHADTLAATLRNGNNKQPAETRFDFTSWGTGQSVVISGSSETGYHLRPSDRQVQQILEQHEKNHTTLSGPSLWAIDSVESSTDRERQFKRPHRDELDE